MAPIVRLHHMPTNCRFSLCDPGLCDDANPDDDVSRPADRSEEQQGKRKRDVKPDHVEPPRKRTGRFDSATVIPEGPGLDVVREWEFLRECPAAQRPRATEQAAKLGASKVTWSFVAGDCAFEALLFATGRTDLSVEGLRQAAVKKVQGPRLAFFIYIQ